ncbi:MAG: hypothetical protein ACRBF0_09230 [Calditrichia bacterium]
MNKQAKIFVPLLLALSAYAFFALFLKKEIGDFDTIRLSGEINQSVYVYVAPGKPFQRDGLNRITSFYVQDRNGAIAQVNLDEPAQEDIANAVVVKVFGHMHGSTFIGKRAETAQLRE